MPSITVRDVPDDARDELASRAARAGQSLQEYLRTALIELARKPDQTALLDAVRARKEQTGSSLSRSRILGHRDAGRK
jgi:antitoxin FitA